MFFEMMTFLRIHNKYEQIMVTRSSSAHWYSVLSHWLLSTPLFSYILAFTPFSARDRIGALVNINVLSYITIVGPGSQNIAHWP